MALRRIPLRKERELDEVSRDINDFFKSGTAFIVRRDRQGLKIVWCEIENQFYAQLKKSTEI